MRKCWDCSEWWELVEMARINSSSSSMDAMIR
nr:MAG TPA: hypothetical protein [Caudoviricetes sp.]